MNQSDEKHRDHVVSNLAMFRNIATHALAGAGADPRGSRRGSLKDALSAIAFAGMAIEATTWIVGCAKLGEPTYALIDKCKLEERLAALGIADPQLLGDAMRFRLVWAELLHERPDPLSGELSARCAGYDEAARTVELLRRIEVALGVPRPSLPAS